MLGQLEQQPLFNALNFSRTIYSGVNSTVYGLGLAALWCPSDGADHRQAQQLRPVLRQPEPDRCLHQLPGMHWHVVSRNAQLLHPVYAPQPMSSCASYQPVNNNMNGIYHYSVSSTIASITDGTSNTFLYSEKANGCSPERQPDQCERHDSLLQLVGRFRLAAIHSSRLSTRSTRTRRSRASRTNTCLRGLQSRIELPSRRCQLRVRGWLGPLHQGFDQLLAVQPGHGIARWG